MGAEIDQPRPAAAGHGHRVRAVNGFRAFSLLGVVVIHLVGFSGFFIAHPGSDASVAIWSIFGNSLDTFFIISGFVLFLPVIRRGGELGNKWTFWVGRGARLLPAFWLVLAIIFLLVAIVPPSPGYQFPTALELAVHVPVMQLPFALLDSGFRIGFGINGPLWMLSIIVTFYALLPFIARAWYRHPLLGLAAAGVIEIAWKQTVIWAPGVFAAISNGSPQFVHDIAVDEFPGWVFSLGIGMTGAWAYTRARERWSAAQLSRGALIAAPLVFGLYALIAWQYGRYALTDLGNFGPTARADSLQSIARTALRAAVIGVVNVGPLWLQRPFADRITDKLADLSYGVYLIHMVIVIWALYYFKLPNDGTLGALAIWFAAVVPLSLLYAATTRRWVEVPARNWIEARLLGGSRRPAAADAPAEAPARP
jgi:peptidoglycan/LPS O-acetylase OafA/YrhL